MTEILATMDTNSLRALMGKKPVDALQAQVKPVTQILQTIEAKAATQRQQDIELMLKDKKIPLSERIRLRKELIETTKDKTLSIAEMAVAPVVIDKSQFSLDITLNRKQLLAAEYAEAGKSFVLTGKAGTGKTTAAREIAKAMLRKPDLGMHYFGYAKETGPAIVFCSYTNRATDNIRRALYKDPALKNALPVNICTIHKLLEYTMEWVTSPDTGNTYPRFYPARDANNKLDIEYLIIEEGSMLDLNLGKQLIDALKPNCVVIVIGDINQLPPVFGPSVLNYALIQLPVVELDEVYRQALDSPILANALRVLDGIMPIAKPPEFLLHQSKPGSTMVTEQTQAQALVNTIKKWHKEGKYDPATDVVLSPFNKEEYPCSTKKLNYHIAQYLGDLVNAKVHEVIAGRNKQYLAVGDRVMIEKQDGTITKININGDYIGKQSHSMLFDINRFGKPLTNQDQDDDSEFLLQGYADLNVEDTPDSEKKVQASHVVTVAMDGGGEQELRSAGDFADNKFNLGYCLSIHKAQGSEWRKVVLVIHRSMNVLLFRELIYTAMTRAREELVIVDMSNALQNAIKTQRIKGNTVKEKIEWFNSKLVMTEPFNVLPAQEENENATN